MAEEFDLERELAAPGVAPDLAAIRSTAARAVELAATIAEIEAMLKEHKTELHDLTTKTLPDQMAEVGLDLLKTEDGATIEIKEFVSGTLPKDDRRDAAIAYLEAHGGGDLIKHQFTVDLGRGDHNTAGELRAQLNQLGAAYGEKEDVHPQTLAAYARERLKRGEAVDLDTLGLYAGRHAKIKLGAKR